jgi:hypothetical protein
LFDFWKKVKYNKTVDKDKIDPMLLASVASENPNSVIETLERISKVAVRDDEVRVTIFETV